jgi:hypothetical protein
MMDPAENGLTHMSVVIPVARRDFCHLGSSFKYSVIYPYGPHMTYRLWRARISYHHCHLPSLSMSHNRLLCDTSRRAQMACISSSTGTLFLITRIRILCFGRWMVSKAREHEPISLWWTIGSVIKFTCFYMEVCKYGISSPKLTDADRCSCPSDSSRFLPSGILIQIFGNISLRTSDDLSTMATPNQSSSLPFSTSLDITSPAQRSPSWRAKSCLNGRYFTVYGHTITLNTHFSSLFWPLDCFQSAQMLAASVHSGGLAVLSKSLIFMQRYVNMMHLVES